VKVVEDLKSGRIKVDGVVVWHAGEMIDRINHLINVFLSFHLVFHAMAITPEICVYLELDATSTSPAFFIFFPVFSRLMGWFKKEHFASLPPFKQTS